MFHYQNEMLAKQRLAETEKRATHAWKFSGIGKKGLFQTASKEEKIEKKEGKSICQSHPCCTSY
jgi:hypothetical protein